MLAVHKRVILTSGMLSIRIDVRNKGRGEIGRAMELRTGNTRGIIHGRMVFVHARRVMEKLVG